LDHSSFTSIQLARYNFLKNKVSKENNQTKINLQKVNLARLLKSKIEKTLLGNICESIDEVFTKETCYLKVIIDTDTLEKLHLQISAEQIKKQNSGR